MITEHTTEQVAGTVLASRMSTSFCYLTVAPIGQAEPVQVRIGMTRRVPVGASVVLSGCARSAGRVQAAGIRVVGPVATAQSREQARLRRWLLSH